MLEQWLRNGWRRCEALAAVGKTVANSEAQLRACEFLLSKQCPDGGWGESYLSCQDKVCPQSTPSGQALWARFPGWIIC